MTANILRVCAAFLTIVLLTVGGWAQRPEQKVTLRIVDWAGIDEMKLDELTIAKFEIIHPEIRVEYEPNPSTQYEEKILTSLAAGSPPDVFLLDSKLIPTFTNKSILLDLSPWIQSEGIDTSIWFPNVLAIGEIGHALYAFPKGFSTLAVFYNKKIFRDAGIPPPDSTWGWNDFLTIARRLTSAKSDSSAAVYGTTFSNFYYYWIPWVWSNGGDVLSPDGLKATGYLDSPATRDALEFLIDLRNRYHCAPDAGSWAQAGKTGSTSAMFVNNSIAMMVDGHWRIPSMMKYVREGKLDVGVLPFPRAPDGRKVNVLYESGWCVPRSTNHPREAALLAAWMAGEYACRVRSAGHLEIPSVITVARQATIDDSTGLMKVFLSEVNNARQPWGSKIERFSEIEWILQDAVDEVLISHRPIDQVLREYSKKIDSRLAEIRSHEHFVFEPIRKHSEILIFLIGTALAVILIGVWLHLKSESHLRRESASGWMFLLPSLVHLTIFMIAPMIFSAYLSFHQWDIVVPDKPFVGLENYRNLMHDSDFWRALSNTFLFVLNVPVSMVLSLSVALLLHRKMKFPGILRTIYFLPSVTSMVAIALVWMWIYHPVYGLANYLLSFFGISPQTWLSSPSLAMASIMIFSVWLNIGYQMVVFLAGLQSIPEVYYQAATIDGAGAWQKFWHVTFPLLRPTTFFILVTSVIGSFQVFTSVYIMTGGGPVGRTDVIVYHIYDAAWNQLRMGYASAMSWTLFALILVATWLQFRLMGKHADYA